MHQIWLKGILITVILTLLSITYGKAQQQIQFTQYMFNGLVINPAYAGADEALSLTFIQRKQWANIEKAPSTQSLSAHTLFKKKQIGLGITLINDKIGIHKNLSVLTNYAYHLKVAEKSYLSMGILAGLHNGKSNYASLIGNANFDPKLYTASNSYTAIDFGMGLYFRSPRLHVGLSAPGLVPKKISINDTLSVRLSKVNYFLFSKYQFKLNDYFDMEPSILLKYFAGIPMSFDMNMNFIYRKVMTLGLSYRKSESIDVMLKGQITPQLQLGYAYDHPIGEVSSVGNGSHELMVQYLFRYVQSNVTSPR